MLLIDMEALGEVLAGSRELKPSSTDAFSSKRFFLLYLVCLFEPLVEPFLVEIPGKARPEPRCLGSRFSF